MNSHHEEASLSHQLIHQEHEFAAHNYHPIPIVIERGQGVHVWDVEGKRYFDFLSAYSALNQGHCHPKIVKTMVEQAQVCTLTSRAFYNAVFPRYAKFMHEYFGYESLLPMNSGAEAVETSIKIARRWAYAKKHVPENEAIIISCHGCFHGRTVTVISMSSDPDCYSTFGPHTPGFIKIEYNSVNALKTALEQYGKKVAAFLIEPIQGEAGVVVPHQGYLSECFKLCIEHNVLFISDEIQTGIGRTGRLLAAEHENIRPHMVILGKALSGGMMPISCVLADNDIMSVITPGSHGSTFGGNPLASAVAISALQVIKDEKLTENAAALGLKLLEGLRAMKSPFVVDIRGKGLLAAIEIDTKKSNKTPWQICMLLAHRGLLCKPTHETTIRLAPPLVITEEQLNECLQIIKSVFDECQSMDVKAIPRLDW